MAYVREGAHRVRCRRCQVAHKDRGRAVIVAHVGSAHTDAELGILLEEARQILIGEQGALDIEAPAQPIRVSDVPDWRTATLQTAQAAPAVVSVGSGRTAATQSRLLYDVLGAVNDCWGLDAVADRVFQDLVIARIVEPTSKLDALRVLADLGAESLSYKRIDYHARLITSSRYRDVVADKCFAYARDCGGLRLLLYDATTQRFEAENDDELREVGYCKERRGDPQIVMVDRTGFPLEIGCQEGNTAETTTIVPIVTSFLTRHDPAGAPMVVAADAGMLSASNLKVLDELDLSFIVGSRSVKAPADLISHFHWHGHLFTDGQVVDTVTPRRGNTTVNDTALPR